MALGIDNQIKTNNINSLNDQNATLCFNEPFYEAVIKV